MENTKMNFFTRLKKAIFKFDEYEKFIVEPTKRSIGYFFQVVVLFSVIITIVLTFQMSKETKKIIETIDTEFPNFTITNNELKLEAVNSFEHYFEDANLNIIIDENNTNLSNTDYANCLMLLKNKIILKYNGYSQEILYTDAMTSSISKENIIEFTKTRDWIFLCVSIGATMFLVCFAIYSIIILIDVVTLAILGLIINILIRTTFKFREVFIISIYSMTLPIILYLIYIVLNVLFGITIKYFEIAYNTIAYIYLITVLLIMKSDIIKNTQELQKILEEQKKVKAELERERQEEKEKQEEANKDREKEKQEEANKDREKEKKKKEKQKDEPEGEPQAEN